MNAELDQHMVSGVDDRVVGLVGDGEVVVRVAVVVLVVDVAVAPVRDAEAAAGAEDVVRPHVVAAPRELPERLQQPLAGRGVGPVDLVVAEALPDPRQRAAVSRRRHGYPSRSDVRCARVAGCRPREGMNVLAQSRVLDIGVNAHSDGSSAFHRRFVGLTGALSGP